jgi:hypothetical protein
MRSPRRSALALGAVFAILALAAVQPLAAYVIWLKDGNRIAARDPYEVQGTRAIITLPNGTQTFIELAKIDVPRTENANRTKDYGATDMGNTKVVPGTPQPAAPTKSITDLINAHRPSARELPAARRPQEKAGDTSHTVSGNVDFATLPRTPYAGADVVADLRELFHSQGFDEVGMSVGTRPDRLLLDFVATSEASLFQSLNASATALLRAQEHFPGKVAAVEVFMQTPTHERAGQFVLTPENASELVSKKTDPATFFVANVQF